jgi:hypothetical protein
MGKLVRWAAAAALIAILGGCVYAPPPAPAYGYAPPGYGYAAPGYAYAPGPYYYGPPVAVGVGVGCCGWHHWR